MPQFQQHEHYISRIADADRPALDFLIASGAIQSVSPLTSIDLNTSNVSIQASKRYTLSNVLDFNVLDDETCVIGDLSIHAQFDGLSTSAYIALVHACPRFSQYININYLLGRFRNGTLASKALQRHLEIIVAQGRRPDHFPRLVDPDRGFTATWVRDKISLLRTPAGDWFIQLVFHTTSEPRYRISQPLAAEIRPTPVPLMHRHELTPAAWRLYLRLVHASHRLDIECPRLDHLDMAQVIALRRQQSRARQRGRAVISA